MSERDELRQLRRELDDINEELLLLLSRRGEVVRKVREVKEHLGVPLHLPEREQAMIDALVARNPGPFPAETVRRLFREIFAASFELMRRDQHRKLLVAREQGTPDHVVDVGGAKIGASPIVIAGPCSIESKEQVEAVADALVDAGVRFIRGGAFKPRTSPYSFQGLGLEGLEMLVAAAKARGLRTVSEVTDPRMVEVMAERVDMLQVGTRNMYNADLLREAGRSGTPVLLKRGLAATVDELLFAAEYVALEGNRDIVLCERGIRTFARETRFTLDVSAIPLLRKESALPVIVDVSHAAGRRDILAPLAAAALAAGAQGVMVEVHPTPAVARSDSQQQLDLEGFREFLATLDL